MLELKPTYPPELARTMREERRRVVRRRARHTVGQLDALGTLTGLVQVIDLSAHGVRFTGGAALEIGRKYALAIQGDWINLSSRIRVISCRAGHVGAEFC